MRGAFLTIWGQKQQNFVILSALALLAAGCGKFRALDNGINLFSSCLARTAQVNQINIGASSLFYQKVQIPFSLKLLYEFFRYFENNNRKNWFRFFMWVNASILVFLVAPVIDKWQGFFSHF